MTSLRDTVLRTEVCPARWLFDKHRPSEAFVIPSAEASPYPQASAYCKCGAAWAHKEGYWYYVMLPTTEQIRDYEISRDELLMQIRFARHELLQEVRRKRGWN